MASTCHLKVQNISLAEVEAKMALAKTLNCLKKMALPSHLYQFITFWGVVHMDANKTTRCDEFAVDNINCSKSPF